MRKGIVLFTSIIILAQLSGCKENAKKNVEAVKDNLEDAAVKMQETIKTEVEMNWEKFKSESEIAIDNTETQIKTLREKIAVANEKERNGLKAGLDTLEQKTQELKERIAERSQKFRENMIAFNETAKERQEKFEREFQHDMKELGQALKDLFKDNIE